MNSIRFHWILLYSIGFYYILLDSSILWGSIKKRSHQVMPDGLIFPLLNLVFWQLVESGVNQITRIDSETQLGLDGGLDRVLEVLGLSLSLDVSVA